MTRISNSWTFHKRNRFRYSDQEEVESMSRIRSSFEVARSVRFVLVLGLALAVCAPMALSQHKPAFVDVFLFGLTTVPDTALSAIFQATADLDAEEAPELLIETYFIDPRLVLNADPYNADLSDSAFGVTAIRFDLEPPPDAEPWIGISEPLPKSVLRPFGVSYIGERAGVIIQPVLAPDEAASVEPIDPNSDLISGYLEAAGTMSSEMLDAVREVLDSLNEGSAEEIRRFIADPRGEFQGMDVFFPSRGFRLIALDVSLALESGALGFSAVLSGLGTFSEGFAVVGDKGVTVIEPAF